MDLGSVIVGMCVGFLLATGGLKKIWDAVEYLYREYKNKQEILRASR